MVSVKICRACFVARYGTEHKVRIVTWGHECADCKTETPPRTTLIKVD